MFHENRVWQGCLKSLVMALFCALSTAAQPMVELMMEPAAQDGVVLFETASGGINIFIDITGTWKQLSWQFQGPGRFSTTEFGGVYLPPETLPFDARPVVIMVTVFDPRGQKVSDTLEFRIEMPLLSLTPTPVMQTPTPVATLTPPPTPTVIITPLMTPTPEATNTLPTPIPTFVATPPEPELSAVDEHLKRAAEYLRKKWYTTPEGQNALAEYQAVLTLEPDNRSARKGIYELAKKYKYWGDREYQKNNRETAKNAYRRYVAVAEYLVNTFHDDAMRNEVEEILARLRELP